MDSSQYILTNLRQDITENNLQLKGIIQVINLVLLLKNI